MLCDFISIQLFKKHTKRALRQHLRPGPGSPWARAAWAGLDPPLRARGTRDPALPYSSLGAQ